jgi:hypothetical protein
MAIDYTVFYASKGAAYRKEKLVKWSHYSEPVDHRAGRVGGNSRIWGDASQAVQRRVIDSIIVAAKKEGFNIRRIAMLLAMANIESGFNPDASAGTTSASGLGQFINKTGLKFGLDASNRFELGPNVSALIKYFIYNEKLVKKKKKPDVWVYKYHHDGPVSDYGGEKLTNEKFAPLAAKYERALNVGHALTIEDPGGAPIADAVIRVTQGGKTALLKTNEKGVLPPIMANPEKGPLTIAIQKANEEFKELGELLITGWNSMWTVTAPKQKFPIKTYLHQKHDNGPAAQTGVHKVDAGQTLSVIARLHGTSYQEIAALNGLKQPYLIYPGQKLKLPPEKKGAHAAPKAAQPPASTKPAQAPAVTQPAVTKPSAPASTPTVAKPVVVEKRSTETKLPEAKVSKPEPSDRIKAMIAYGLAHKEGGSSHYCLRYVKAALLAAGYFSAKPSTRYAKDFAPKLDAAGFENLLVTKPGTTMENAPIGSISIYRPVESQRYTPPGEAETEIPGHIDIKCEVDGRTRWLSDFLANNPAYSVNPKTMVSKVSPKYHASFKITGIWYKP